MLALIQLDFDPLLRIGELTLRWQTIGVTVALLAAFGFAALMATDVGQPFSRRRSAGDRSPGPRFTGAAQIEPGPAAGDREADLPLRIDELVLIVIGIVPGAAIGGRLVHVLAFWEAYAADPLRIIDPAVGSLSLLGAVLGGWASAVYVARMIGAPVRRWADAAALPLLIAVGLGKLAQVLGGSGQGLPFDGAWALVFLGDGPWVSANPHVPAHPSQVYEGLWMVAPIPYVVLWGRARRLWQRILRRPASVGGAGRLFVGTIAWFLTGRVLIGFTWRDDALLGSLNAEQLMALIALVVVLIGARLWRPRYRGREQPRPQERSP